ncbi:MAG: hypothetical protein Q7K35_05460 [bacterium]|nr:hypothetical protein [bacterium]
MKSRWYESKENAIKLRQQGFSIGKIERDLGIPRSTLSGWLKNIKLTRKQKEELLRNWKNGLIKARQQAVIWHNAQKAGRIKDAENSAKRTLKNIDLNDKNILELALAFLYLGEGAKNNPETALGSSNPLILKFFLSLLKSVYNIKVEKIGCELSLRADQNPDEMKKFWSQALKIPIDRFKQVHLDKRTLGSKTYQNYKGVCHLRCGNVAIQRKLVYIANLFCEKIIDKNLGS